MSSRFEELLQALLSGDIVAIVPRSRLEAALKNCIEGCGCEGLTEPKSRTEVYLQALAEKLKGGGSGVDYPTYDGEPLDIAKTEFDTTHVVFTADTEPMVVGDNVSVRMKKTELGGVMAHQVPEGYTFTSQYGINQVGEMPVYDYTPIKGHYFRDDGEGNFVFDASLESFVVLEDEVSIKVPKKDFGNAYPHMVVDGWEFTSSNGVKIKGTMLVYDYTPLEGWVIGKDEDGNFLFGANTPSQVVLEDEVNLKIAKSNFGDATPADVRAGKTFTSADGIKLVGTREDA